MRQPLRGVGCIQRVFSLLRCFLLSVRLQVFVALLIASLLSPPRAPLAVIVEFAKVSMNMLAKGADGVMSKTFASAAKKLSAPVGTVRSGCQALCQLFVTSARNDLAESDVADRLRAVGFRETAQAALAAMFAENAAEMCALVTAAPTVRGVANYADLQWRLDVRTSSRALATEAEPVFLVQLDTERQAPAPGARSGGRRETRLMEMDYATMRETCDELERALAAAEGATARRIQKYVRRKAF